MTFKKLFLSAVILSSFSMPLAYKAAMAQEDAGETPSVDIPSALVPEESIKEGEAFPQSQPEPPMPAVLKESIRRGAQSKYLGRYHGLDGWVVVKGGKSEFHYATQDGKAIIMGLLFDDAGNMITGEQLRMLRLSDGASTYKLSETSQKRAEDKDSGATSDELEAEEPKASEEPKEKANKSELFYAAVEKGNWLRIGERNAPIMYAFIDPDCEHCQKFLRDIEPYIERGTVQLRILPVGFAEMSLKRASYLLAAPEPKAQLYKYINGDKEALFVPGDIQTIGAVNNVAIMQQFKLVGTPVITYRDRTDVVRFVRGAPDSVAVIVDELER